MPIRRTRPVGVRQPLSWLVAMSAVVFSVTAPAPIAGASTTQPASTKLAAAEVTVAGKAAAELAAADCTPGQSGAAVPTSSRGDAAIQTMIGVAKTMQVPYRGEIIAVMVMLQESSIRNLANDGTSPQQSWPAPGRDYWLSVTKLSLKYPHDLFGSLDGAHDTDSIGLYQQRPAWGWGDYGNSTGRTDPEGVVQRLLDPRWEAMAFFGGDRSAAPTQGLLRVPGWEGMSLTDAAEAVQGSTQGDLYAKWESLATQKIQAFHGSSPAIELPWYPGGGSGALACTSIPGDPGLGESGRNPAGNTDIFELQDTRIRVNGWAFDRDAINGVVVIDVVDVSSWGTTYFAGGLANRSRPDVSRAFGLVGNFGFDFLIPWTGPGAHTICLSAVNIGRGTGNTSLGCRSITVPGPIGAVDQVVQTADGRLRVTGWAADPQAPGQRVQVHIYAYGPNGTKRGTSGNYTGLARADVARAHPWAGGTAGYRATVVPAAAGENTVCVYAINVNAPRNNPNIGCRKVIVRSPTPIGHLDAVTVTGNRAAVRGWALIRATPSAAIPVHITVENAGTSVLIVVPATTIPRADVNRVYQISGNHGFSQTVDLGPGSNTVCIFGLRPDGTKTQLGCSVVQRAPVALRVAPQTIAPQTNAPQTNAPQTIAPLAITPTDSHRPATQEVAPAPPTPSGQTDRPPTSSSEIALIPRLPAVGPGAPTTPATADPTANGAASTTPSAPAAPGPDQRHPTTSSSAP